MYDNFTREKLPRYQIKTQFVTLVASFKSIYFFMNALYWIKIILNILVVTFLVSVFHNSIRNSVINKFKLFADDRY